MLVDDVTARIKATIPALDKRVEGAAELAELIRAGALPAASPFAYVLPLGLRPRDQGEAATGAFVQNIDETISIVLIVQGAGDATGGKSLTRLEPLINGLIANLCGWAPGEEIGVFRLARGSLLPRGRNGTNFYQLDISIQSQIRNLV